MINILLDNSSKDGSEFETHVFCNMDGYWDNKDGRRN
jgi:hypothetical protein